MTEGAWITVAVTSAGTFGTIITALIKSPFKKNGSSVIPDPQKCPAHSGLVAEISSLNQGIKRLETGINEIRNDTKMLLERRTRTRKSNL
jgi:hypothetical protein